MSETDAVETLDLRVVRTRKHVIQALFELMQEKPFQKISVRDITERAMVNRSTFYAHFVDKYDLFTIAIGQRIRDDLAGGLAAAESFTEENLRTLISLTGDLVLKISHECTPTPLDDLLPLIMTEMQNSIYDVTLRWAENLPQTQRGERSPETVAMVSAGTIFGSVNLWGQDKRGLTIDQLADEIMPLLMDGIGALVIGRPA